jgi:hypothetical protein
VGVRVAVVALALRRLLRRARRLRVAREGVAGAAEVDAAVACRR